MARATPQIHIEGDRVRVPATTLRHSGFREWIKSSEFPEGVRATYASGQVFVEMSPEATETHNKVKLAISTDLLQLVRSERLGEAYADGTLLTHVGAAISTEPDFLFATWEAFESGRLRLIEKANRHDDYIELEGTPDLVVEIVSDSSARKDHERLPRLYAAAGVPELWLVDAREELLRFEIFALVGDGFRGVAPDAQGWFPSALLSREFRLLRRPAGGHRWGYRLDSRPLTR